MATRISDIDAEHVQGVKSNTVPERAEERGARRLTEVASRFPFAIYLFIVSLLAMGALGLAGTRGAYQYDVWLPVIVLFYGAAIMTWPIVVAGRVKQHRVLRMAIAAGSIIAMPIFIMLLMFFFTKSGVFQWAWSGPLGIGPILLPSLAIILHALVALMLARVKPAGENTVQHLTNQQPSAEKMIDVMQKIVDRKQLQVAAIGDSIKGLSTQHETADTEVKRLEGIRDAAKVALDALPSHVAVETAKAALKDAQERGAKDAEIDALEATLESASLVHTKTNEWAEYQAALRSVGAAAVTTAELARQIKAANERLTDAIRDWSEQAAALTSLGVELDELVSKLDEARKDSKSGRGDVVFVPITLLFIAGLLYTVWYGWVLSSLNSLL